MNVLLYDHALGNVKALDVVNAAVIYDFPETGKVIIFNTDQASQYYV